MASAHELMPMPQEAPGARAPPPENTQATLGVHSDLHRLLLDLGNDAELAATILNALADHLHIGRDPSISQFYHFMANHEGGVTGFFKVMSDQNPVWAFNGALLLLLDRAFEAAEGTLSDDPVLSRRRAHPMAPPEGAVGAAPRANGRPTTSGSSSEATENLNPRHMLALELTKQLRTRSGYTAPVRGTWCKVPDPSSSDGLGTSDPYEPGFNAWASPIHFVEAIAAHLRSLADAGRYFVEDPVSQTRSLMVDAEMAELHLAECQLFARKWMTNLPRPENKDITIRLRDTDLEIRASWWNLFEVNLPEGISFTACIRKSRLIAAALWAEANSHLATLTMGDSPPAALKRQHMQQEGTDSGTEEERKESAGQAKRRRRYESAYTRWLSNKEKPVRVLPKNTVGKPVAAEGQKGKFCMDWNWQEGGCHAGRCGGRHVCNVLVHKSYCCGSANHRGRDHEGPEA